MQRGQQGQWKGQEGWLGGQRMLKGELERWKGRRVLRGSSQPCCRLLLGHWLSSAHINPAWAEEQQPGEKPRAVRERPLSPSFSPCQGCGVCFFFPPATPGGGKEMPDPSSSASHQMFELTRSDSLGRPRQAWTAPVHPAPSLINSPSPDNILLSCGLFSLAGTCQTRASEGFNGIHSKQSNKCFSLVWFCARGERFGHFQRAPGAKGTGAITRNMLCLTHHVLSACFLPTLIPIGLPGSDGPARHVGVPQTRTVVSMLSALSPAHTQVEMHLRAKEQHPNPALGCPSPVAAGLPTCLPYADFSVSLAPFSPGFTKTQMLGEPHLLEKVFEQREGGEGPAIRLCN